MTPDDKIALLRAALAPFADYAQGRRLPPDSYVITQGSSMARRQLTVGDCKRALEAFSGTLAKDTSL